MKDEYNAEPDFGLEFPHDNGTVDLENILSGKINNRQINNRQDAEEECIKKIKEDEDYLGSARSTNKDFLHLKNIFKKTKYAVFGLFSHQKKEQMF